jgi:hypothetical protein
MTTNLQAEKTRQNVLQLYPVYQALAREFVIDVSALPLEDPVDENTLREWFLQVDAHIEIHQLRQFLQTTNLISDEILKATLSHHLSKQERDSRDRDKVDFLLVQLFSQTAPSQLNNDDVDLAYVAQLLEPTLGGIPSSFPSWLEPLDALIQHAQACESLKDLFAGRIIEKGRELKASSGDGYFDLGVLVAFTRFNFLMRRVFFRLMHQDLHAILDGVRELELRGVETVDCRCAHFSKEEPVGQLRLICQSWKVMFQAEYSSGQALRMLVDLRSAVTVALAQEDGAQQHSEVSDEAQHRNTFAAVAASPSSSSGAQEFRIEPGQPGWDEE